MASMQTSVFLTVIFGIIIPAILLSLAYLIVTCCQRKVRLKMRKVSIPDKDIELQRMIPRSTTCSTPSSTYPSTSTPKCDPGQPSSRDASICDHYSSPASRPGSRGTPKFTIPPPPKSTPPKPISQQIL